MSSQWVQKQLIEQQNTWAHSNIPWSTWKHLIRFWHTLSQAMKHEHTDTLCLRPSLYHGSTYVLRHQEVQIHVRCWGHCSRICMISSYWSLPDVGTYQEIYINKRKHFSRVCSKNESDKELLTTKWMKQLLNVWDCEALHNPSYSLYKTVCNVNLSS